MSVVANLTAMLTANTSRFETPMKKAASTTDLLNGKLGNLGGVLNNLGGYLSGGALLIGFKSSINAMDEMVKTADRLGISVESLSKMAYVGKLADVSMDDLEKTIRTMQRTLVETPQALDSLGLSAQKFIDMNPDDAFLELVNAIVAIENPTIRNAKALEVFGRSGLQLINFASDGSKGIKELYEEAERLGIVLKDETARGAERLNDNLTRLNQSIQGVFIQASNTGALDVMAESLTTLLNLVVDVTSAYGDLLRAFGADLSGEDTIKRIQRETAMQIEVQKAFLRVVQGQPASPVRDNAIAKTTAEIERLEKVAANASKYFDESGNIVRPSTKRAATTSIKSDSAPAKVKATTEAVIEQKDEVQKLDDSFDDLGMTFTSAFEDAIVEGKKFSDVLKGLAQDILRIATRRMVTDPLSNAASGFFGNLTSGIFGGNGAPSGGLIGPTQGGSIFDSIAGAIGFADGGVPPTNKLSIVGERGPELFVPSTRGTIIPNEALGGGANTYVIDARGTDSSVVRRLEQALFQLAGPGVVEQRVADAQARGAI